MVDEDVDVTNLDHLLWAMIMRTDPAESIQFLKGTLVGVECPAGPGATVTLESGGKKWRMKTSDRDKLVLIGTEQFSCDWKDVKVAVNYKLAGTLEGDLVSLELQ